MKILILTILLTVATGLMAGQSCPMPDHSDCPDDCPGYQIKMVSDCMEANKGSKKPREKVQAECTQKMLKAFNR